jgi:hypothetical protein
MMNPGPTLVLNDEHSTVVGYKPPTWAQYKRLRSLFVGCLSDHLLSRLFRDLREPLGEIAERFIRLTQDGQQSYTAQEAFGLIADLAASADIVLPKLIELAGPIGEQLESELLQLVDMPIKPDTPADIVLLCRQLAIENFPLADLLDREKNSVSQAAKTVSSLLLGWTSGTVNGAPRSSMN